MICVETICVPGVLRGERKRRTISLSLRSVQAYSSRSAPLFFIKLCSYLLCAVGCLIAKVTLAQSAASLQITILKRFTTTTRTTTTTTTTTSHLSYVPHPWWESSWLDRKVRNRQSVRIWRKDDTSTLYMTSPKVF